MDWHDESCRKADIVSFGDGRSCLSCGAVAPKFPSSLLPPIRQLAEIRILSLKFGSSSEPIVCDIFTHDLSTHPDYEAISYTWADDSGDATKSRTIQVSGKSFPVTANCEDALRRVRRRFSDRKVWIDAVCIDQDNVEERGHQVGLMPRIYAGAKHVLIYVGEATDRSAEALTSVAHGPIHWVPFLGIMSRRYFTRAWTLQEVALARNATLLCGPDSIPWALLSRSVRKITSSTFDPPQTQDILLMLPPQLSFDYSMYSSPGRVLALLDLGRRSQAADPRDKVFSLLGLMPGGRIGDIEADYSMDTCELYTKLAEYLGSQHGWLQVLARAGTSSSSMTSDSSMASLPSWVPDWSRGLSTRPLEPSELEFHPYVNGICDTNEKTLAIGILILGFQHLDVRKQGRTPVKSLSVHWDSYVAERIKTHIWSPDWLFLSQGSTACLDFLNHLLDTTHLAVDGNTYPSIISHQMGDFRLEMTPQRPSSHHGPSLGPWVGSSCGKCVMKSFIPTFSMIPYCGVPIETAAQIFTLTIAEMVHLDIFTAIGIAPNVPRLENGTESEENHASISRYLEAVFSYSRAELAAGAPMDPALGNIWGTKYNAGELSGVKARNQSSLRIMSCIDRRNNVGPTYTAKTVTPAEMERGLWSTRHPLFAEANEILWKMFLHRYLYREISITLC